MPTDVPLTPQQLLDSLLSELRPVAAEVLARDAAAVRILAEPIMADRDSPPLDVSSMDGFAVRAAEINAGALPIAGDVPIGHSPPALPPAAALRIFTGSCIPEGADAVVPKERVSVDGDRITLQPGVNIPTGMSIRRQGENLRAGEVAIVPQRVISPTVLATLATFGLHDVTVYRRVTVAILTTGDEVLPPDETPAPWQIRNANGTTLQSMLSPVPWVQITAIRHVPDDPASITGELEAAITSADVVIMTGSASVGDHDYLHAALRAIEAREIFSTLPIRPGKPTTAAITRNQKLILGLPGNPVAVAITMRRFGLPALRALAGLAEAELPTFVHVEHAGTESLHLWWYRPVALADDRITVVPSMSSGDIVSAGRGDGFVEIPPGQPAAGLRRFWPWHMS